MKAIVLKPIMWNTKNYIKPSGYPSKGGFAHDHGYGHEEWNNNSHRVWRGYKIFHTEATKKLLKYSATGELGIVTIASCKGKQYAISVATSVYHNDEDERNLIAKELGTYEEWQDVWQVELVRERFDNNQQNFLSFWEKNYRWIRWKCPIDQYHHFENPIPLDPTKISKKKRLVSLHGRFQAIHSEQVLEFIGNELSVNHPIVEWLSNPDFDEEIIPKELRDSRENRSNRILRGRISRSGSNSPAIRKYQYWIEGNRSVEPHHAKLQAKYVEFLGSEGIQFRENTGYVDVQYQLNNQIYFAEIKPTETVETKYAIRMAVGQLLEYRFKLNRQAQLEIVLGSKPTDEEKNFVASLGIFLTFYDRDTSSFVRLNFSTSSGGY